MTGFRTALLGGAMAVGAALAAAGGAAAQQQDGQELNIYSARHYQTDETLYAEFEEQTGITINRIEAEADALVERIKSEGPNSPADVLITVDAGRLWRAEQEGVLQPVESEVLEQRIPESLRDPEGHWFGFSTRARVIVYNKEAVDPVEDGLDEYEDLADPRFDDMVCIRSSSNVYNLSLLGSLIAHHGEAEAEAWAEGVAANFARPPQGGDTDQIKAVASGECAVGVANHYYYLRLATSDDPEERAVAEKVGVIFPNQDGRGAHVNISGAGVVAGAPHPEAAVRFLEYLAGDEAQRYFAEGNNEYPAVEGVSADNPALEKLGEFKVDPVNVAAYGDNQPLAQKIFDRVGWK